MRKSGGLSLLFIACSFSTLAQQRICACAPSFSPLAAADFESFFDPSVIKSKRITEVIIHITPGQKNNKTKADTTVKGTSQKYIQELFRFNRDGYAVQKRTFNPDKQDHFFSFNRDSKNNIVQSVSQFFDSTGRISAETSPEITDYTLDEYGDIVKRKKRGVNGNILPDEKSEYTITEYNSAGFKTKETTHFYWDWREPPDYFNITYFTYANKGKTETARTYDNKKLYLTTTTNYDDAGAPLTVSSFNYFINKTAYKKVFKYDSLGRLIKYVQSSGGGVSECKDRGNFSNEFKYNSDGLLIEQRHTFANTLCVLQFEYK
jgi:hypothetical protein